MSNNRTKKAPKYFDDRYADLSAMTDAELDQHIETLKCSASEHKSAWGRDDVAVLTMIQLAVEEKHNRVATKQIEASNALAQETLNLTKQTIHLWWAAIGLAVLSIVIAIWGIWR